MTVIPGKHMNGSEASWKKRSGSIEQRSTIHTLLKESLDRVGVEVIMHSLHPETDTGMLTHLRNPTMFWLLHQLAVVVGHISLITNVEETAEPNEMDLVSPKEVAAAALAVVVHAKAKGAVNPGVTPKDLAQALDLVDLRARTAPLGLNLGHDRRQGHRIDPSQAISLGVLTTLRQGRRDSA